MIRFHLGDWLTIQWRGNTARDISILPREAIGRMAKVIPGSDEHKVSIQFPYPVKMNQGNFQREFLLPKVCPGIYFKLEHILPTDYPKGRADGAVMVPVQPLYDRYWGKFAPDDPVWLYKDSSMPLQAEIEKEGMRNPIILNRDLVIRHGSHRVLVYHRLGKDEIEAYITTDISGHA